MLKFFLEIKLERGAAKIPRALQVAQHTPCSHSASKAVVAELTLQSQPLVGDDGLDIHCGRWVENSRWATTALISLWLLDITMVLQRWSNDGLDITLHVMRWGTTTG
jgi:hypothetical protein